MSAWAIPPRLERGDRYIRRTRLQVSRDTPRQRTLFMLEEALRLTALPGEEQGRVYFFRSVSFGKLPVNADRRAWLDRIQFVLTQWAARASHGADPRAALSSAVFFRSRQEALELLLLRLVRGGSTGEWYWPLVVGAEPGTNYAERIALLVETLRESPGGWVSTASAVFAVLAIADSVSLLTVLPPARLQTWLREMGSAEATIPYAAPAAIPQESIAPVRRAAEWFGPDAAQTLWIASLAVLLAAPAALPARSAVARARAILRQIGRPMPANTQGPPEAAPPQIAQLEPPATPAASLCLDDPADGLPPAELRVPHPAEYQLARLAAPAPAPLEISPLPHGQITAYAGLYFLLNALERLGIARTPALADPGFAPELMERLAVYAGIPPADPICGAGDPARGRHSPPPKAGYTRDCPRQIRVLLVGVRRWCWRSARLTLREVVTRPGAVCWTRTDLDILMPLDSAEIRIRRIGLDLDPGWVPWFGRVVRFHYQNNWKDGLP